MSKKVYIFLADGFEDIEGLTVVDLMRRAGITITTVSIKNTKQITTAHGITMLTDTTFREADFSDADMLVLPGGQPGTTYLGGFEPLTDLVKSFYNNGGKIAAICAAPTIFAEIGLLHGKKATAYPACMDGLGDAVKSEEKVVIDGNITTSRGLGTAIDFALSLISQLLGQEKAVSRKCCGYKHQHNCKYNVFRYSLLKRCIGFENQVLLYKEVYGLGCCSCNQKA